MPAPARPWTPRRHHAHAGEVGQSLDRRDDLLGRGRGRQRGHGDAEHDDADEDDAHAQPAAAGGLGYEVAVAHGGHGDDRPPHALAHTREVPAREAAAAALHEPDEVRSGDHEHEEREQYARHVGREQGVPQREARPTIGHDDVQGVSEEGVREVDLLLALGRHVRGGDAHGDLACRDLGEVRRQVLGELEGHAARRLECAPRSRVRGRWRSRAGCPSPRMTKGGASFTPTASSSCTRRPGGVHAQEQRNDEQVEVPCEHGGRIPDRSSLRT